MIAIAWNVESIWMPKIPQMKLVDIQKKKMKWWNCIRKSNVTNHDGTVQLKCLQMKKKEKYVCTLIGIESKRKKNNILIVKKKTSWLSTSI